MNGWQRSLLWEGLPFLLLFGIFGLLLAINPEYESKLFALDHGGTAWTEIYLGPILLGIALAFAAAASAILLFVRLANSAITSSGWMFLPLTVVFIFLILPSLFIVVLGPAEVTLVEQMRALPR